MAEFTMPALGADMDEGTLLEWRVQPGDPIHKGEIIAVVDTAKSAIEVESFHTGTIDKLLAEPGDTFPVGAPLALITEPEPGAAPAAGPAGAAPARPGQGRATPLVRRAAQELGIDLARVPGTGRAGAITRADVERAAGIAGTVAARPAGRPAIEPAPAPAPAVGVGGAAADAKAAQPGRLEAEPARTRAAPGEGEPAGAPRRRVSPLARRVAAELGVDVESVAGTGPGGAVREQDIRQAAGTRAPPAASPGEARAAAGPERAKPAERLRAMRQVTAALMARSKREIPHYYLANTIDLSVAMTWLRERNRALPVPERLVPAALLLKATALAAREVPDLNGYWREDGFEPAPAIHLGVAVSLRGGGLVTPAIHDADGLRLGELMGRLRDLVGRARGGRLRGSELTDATITVTNLGDQGVESVTGVIYPPQVALAGFGKVSERPWAVGGLLGVRPAVVSTLAADHRATDGYTGARFLAAVDAMLQRPEDL